MILNNAAPWCRWNENYSYMIICDTYAKKFELISFSFIMFNLEYSHSTRTSERRELGNNNNNRFLIATHIHWHPTGEKKAAKRVESHKWNWSMKDDVETQKRRKRLRTLFICIVDYIIIIWEWKKFRIRTM